MSEHEQKKAPEASVWATSTDLAGTPHERKVYFILIRDGDRELNIALTHRPTTSAVEANVYQVADYDYTIHDMCHHDRNKCVLDDPDFEENWYGPQPVEVYQEVRKVG